MDRLDYFVDEEPAKFCNDYLSRLFVGGNRIRRHSPSPSYFKQKIARHHFDFDEIVRSSEPGLLE